MTSSGRFAGWRSCRTRLRSVSRLWTDCTASRPHRAPAGSSLLRQGNLLAVAEASLIVQVEDLRRREAIESHVKWPAGNLDAIEELAGDEELANKRVLLHVGGERRLHMGSLCQFDAAPHELETFDLLPVVVVLVDRRGYIGIRAGVLRMAGLRLGKEVEGEVDTGIEDRGGPKPIGAERSE